ncbi:MAG: AbrB/MazE/SpoVT family DNA-binding domain-containing protein [Candidatus Omnitrophica bacterium]|nr:AbrB/MazE/SpoVT family DNA-binding domain-containing protein [Candidatus Omnitrophota bacterium]
MTQVTVSSKYQVVIPREVRRQLPLRMGQKLAVLVKEGVITLLPDRPLSAFRGFLKDMRVGAIRDKRDRV